MTTEIAEFSELEAGIAKLAEEYNFIPQCSTDDGFERTKKDFRVIRNVEIKLEEKRVELNENHQTAIKKTNLEAKSIDGRLKLISSPFKTAIDDWKKAIANAEKLRVEGLKAEITALLAFVDEAYGKTSAEISDIIESVDMIEVDEHFDEFQFEARNTLNDTKTRLGSMLVTTLQAEAAQRETDKAKEAQAESDAENARLRAELDALKADKEPEETDNTTVGMDAANKTTTGTNCVQMGNRGSNKTPVEYIPTDFEKGYIAGLTAYAWWKDGIQYVGTCGTTLENAIHNYLNGE